VGASTPTAERGEHIPRESVAQSPAKREAGFGVGGIVKRAEAGFQLAEAAVSELVRFIPADTVEIALGSFGAATGSIATLAARVRAVDAATPPRRLGDRRAAGIAVGVEEEVVQPHPPSPSPNLERGGR